MFSYTYYQTRFIKFKAFTLLAYQNVSLRHTQSHLKVAKPQASATQSKLCKKQQTDNQQDKTGPDATKRQNKK